MMQKMKNSAAGIAKIGSSSPTVLTVEKNIILSTIHILGGAGIYIISFLFATMKNNCTSVVFLSRLQYNYTAKTVQSSIMREKKLFQQKIAICLLCAKNYEIDGDIL